MKKIYKSLNILFSLLFACYITINAETHTITNMGFTFSPNVITINLGDTVRFVLEPSHNAVEVSEATWSTNGNTSNGGFIVPFGGGIVVPTEVKTYYYVCQPHAFMGMKGKIVVNNPVPEIISISPQLGPIGTIITILGSGFSETPSQNTVLLGLQELIVISASSTQIVCKVPEGSTTGEIKVIVNGRTSSPPYQNFVVLPNRFEFLPNVIRNNVYDITACDIDGDNSDDALLLGRLINQKERPPKGHVTLLKRTASSKATPSAVYSIPDFDLDSNLTSFATRKCCDECPSDFIAVFGTTRQTQGATFGERMKSLIILQHNNNPNELESDFKIYRNVLPFQDRKVSTALICDLTNDDSVDVVFAYEPSDGMPGIIQVITNIPGGGAASAAYVATGSIIPIGDDTCTDIEISDVDGDGLADIICSTRSGPERSGKIYYIKNYYPSTGGWATRQIIDGEHPYSSLIVSDVNKDGRPDILAIRSDIGQLIVCIADSVNPEQFLSPIVVDSNIHSNGNLIAGDLDADGYNDIVCRSSIPGQSVSIFIIDDVTPGGEVVSKRIDLGVCDSDSVLFTVGKFDNDNYLDFVFYGCTTTNIAPPLISNISPDIGIAGTTFSIDGENLDNTNSVRLGDLECDIISSSSSKLLVKWPSSARTRGSINIFEEIRVSSTNGICFALKNLSVSPVYIYSVPQIGNLEQIFLEAGDIDNDGKAEAVVYNIKPPRYSNGHVTLLRAFDDGGGESERIISTTFPDNNDEVEDISIGDYNADGYLDIARLLRGRRGPFMEINFQSALVRGSFIEDFEKKRIENSLSNFHRFVPGIGDINGDGLHDIVYITRNLNGDGVVILLNNPSNPGSFLNVSTFGLCCHYDLKTAKPYTNYIYASNSVAQGFFKLAVLTSNEINLYGFENGSTLVNLGTIDIRNCNSDRFMEVCDINNDGKNDFVVVDSDSSIMTVCLNIDNLNFKVIEIKDLVDSFSSSGNFYPVVMDFNGDGKVDIGINEPGINLKSEPDVYVWKIKYNRTSPMDTVLRFENSYVSMIKSGSGLIKIAIGDLDGDGISDMIIKGSSSRNINPPMIRNINNRNVGGRPTRIGGYDLATAKNVRLHCVGCPNPIDLSYSVLSDSELTVVIPPDFGRKFIGVFNTNASNWYTSPIIIMEAPDMFVSVPPESLVLTESNGKFKKPVKRGKGQYPNWTNLLEEVVVQGGFQPGASESDEAGGMVIGISHIYEASPNKWRPIKDSALIRAWVAIRGWDLKKNVGKNWSGIQKTLKNRNFEHSGIARGLDSTGNPGDPKRKRLRGELKILDPKKTSNKLFAELVALKFNIAASQLGKTPVGFGELIYDNDSSMFDEMSVINIARAADSAMTYYSKPLYDWHESLYRAIYQINRAFIGPLDTATFEVGRNLTLNGVVDLSTVPYMKMPTSFKPRILYPTTTLTESVEDDKDIEDIETLPTLARLYQNYPNPFNPTTTISFGLRNSSIVTLKIYNMLGQEVVSVMEDQELIEGDHVIEFDAGNLSSGVYVYRIVVEELKEGANGLPNRYVEQRKMLLLK